MAEPQNLKKVIIHIGLHKTGSTYIQRILTDNRAVLPSWLASFNQADGSSRPLHRACQNYQLARGKNKDGLAERAGILARCEDILQNTPETADTILISDEEISGIMPGRLGQFRMYPELFNIASTLVEGFAPCDVHFVIYTRKVNPWIRSVYNQAVKQHRVARNFQDFRKAIPDPLQPAPLIDMLKSATGAEKVKVVAYEADINAEHGLGTGLLEYAGLSDPEIAALERVPANVNPSLHPKALELVRALNATDIESSQLQKTVQVLLHKAGLFEGDDKGNDWPAKPPPEVPLKLDRVFYVNLDTRPDRRRHMENILAGCPAPVERIPGVMLDKDPEELGITMNPQRTGQRGPAGIWLAHQACLERALETEGDGAIVLLEDDLWLTKHFWAKDFTVPGPLPEEWDMLMLSPRLRAKQALDGMYFAPITLKRPVRLKSFPLIASGAHFVIFRNREAVRRVLNTLHDAKVTDVDLFYVENLMTYGVSVSNVTAGGFGSDH